MSKGGTGEEPIESNDINNLNLVYGFIKTSKEEPKKFNEKELNSYDDYIKVKDVYTFHDFITSQKLESEKEELNKKLFDKCKLIKDLNKDIKRMETERLLCMIYESYQRFKTQMTEDLELIGGMKIEAFFEAVKRGEILSDDRLIYWMINIDSTKGMQVKTNREMI